MMQGVSKQQIMGWALVDKEKIDSRPNTTVMNAKLSQQKYRPWYDNELINQIYPKVMIIDYNDNPQPTYEFQISFPSVAYLGLSS